MLSLSFGKWIFPTFKSFHCAEDTRLVDASKLDVQLQYKQRWWSKISKIASIVVLIHIWIFIWQKMNLFVESIYPFQNKLGIIIALYGIWRVPSFHYTMLCDTISFYIVPVSVTYIKWRGRKKKNTSHHVLRITAGHSTIENHVFVTIVHGTL